MTELLTDVNAPEWDAFVDASDAHWLWSRSEWGRYQKAYGASWGPGELQRGAAGDIVEVRPGWPRNDETANLLLKLGPDKEMWGRIRKGHRADIKRGDRLLWTQTDNTGKYFVEYEQLHRAAFGSVRSPETFLVMYELIQKGFAMLKFARLSASDTGVGAALFFKYKRKAYYASAPRLPGSSGLPIGHVLMWDAMCDLADDGYTELDLGPATEGRPSIDAFKRHFGADFPAEVEGAGPRSWMAYP